MMLTKEQRQELCDMTLECEWGDIETEEDLESFSDSALLNRVNYWFGVGTVNEILGE